MHNFSTGCDFTYGSNLPHLALRLPRIGLTLPRYCDHGRDWSLLASMKDASTSGLR